MFCDGVFEGECAAWAFPFMYKCNPTLLWSSCAASLEGARPCWPKGARPVTPTLSNCRSCRAVGQGSLELSAWRQSAPCNPPRCAPALPSPSCGMVAGHENPSMAQLATSFHSKRP